MPRRDTAHQAHRGFLKSNRRIDGAVAMRIELNSERSRAQCRMRASCKLRSSLGAEEKCVFVPQPITFCKAAPAESLRAEPPAIRDFVAHYAVGHVSGPGREEHVLSRSKLPPANGDCPLGPRESSQVCNSQRTKGDPSKTNLGKFSPQVSVSADCA